MEEKILLAELKKNCEGKQEKVLELLKTYELAELGSEVQRQQFKDIENKVLKENEFFCGRPDIKVRSDDQPIFGERITDEKWDFLLSDDDFDRLQSLMLPLYVEENLTDENGYYIKNWDMIAIGAKRELVEYVIKEVIPSFFRNLFWENRTNVVFQDKLIKITKDAFGFAA